VTPTIPVEKQGQRWVARCSFSQKEIVKAAGFRWDPNTKSWYTTSETTAMKLADPDVQTKIVQEVEQKQVAKAEAIVASRASDADVDIPRPEGLEYLPYQRAGIATAMQRQNVLFGDDPGLGKTIQFAGMLNTDQSIRKVLIVCPATLRLNWRRELRKWLVRDMSIALADAKSFHPSMADIHIMTYEAATKLADRLREVAWDAICCDEAHYLKNPKAKRTIAIVGRRERRKKDKRTGEWEIVETGIPGVQATRKAMLTGTPIPNRPIEGFPIFHYLDQVNYPDFFRFAKRYCGAYDNGHGWDFSGASHLDELQDLLRSTIMIRRRKADVLLELPAKRRSVIEVPSETESHILEAERMMAEEAEERMFELRAAVELAKASDDTAEYRTAVAALTEAATAAFTEMAQARHDAALATVPYAIEHLKAILEGGEKVVVFAHHHDVIKKLMDELAEHSPVAVYGETDMRTRDANVQRFQTDPGCMVFVGGILAAGVGITLTAASRVVFVELDWVPGNMTQAEDRCHRIGQRDMVVVEHLVLEGSVAAKMAQTIVSKQDVIDRALDKKPEVTAPALPVREKERAATDSATREGIAKEAEAFTAERIEAVHRGLQMLAGMCDGARSLDGAGFNKMDTFIGRSLAEAWVLSPKQAALGAKLVNKYRRQLPEQIVTLAKGNA
jgi:SNF2 family DNA or RNA helicase